MEKLYSKIVGTPVFDDDFGRPVTTIKDIVLDPEDGKVVALVTNVSKNLVVSPVDILSWQEVVRIHNKNAIVNGEEILRVDRVQKSGIKIFHNKVYTKEEKYLGIVADFSIDSNSLTLNKLFIAKTFLGLVRYESRIMSAKKIVEILPDKIIVESDIETVKEKKVEVEDLAVG